LQQFPGLFADSFGAFLVAIADRRATGAGFEVEILSAILIPHLAAAANANGWLGKA
jgi:hypothetical protein